MAYETNVRSDGQGSQNGRDDGEGAERGQVVTQAGDVRGQHDGGGMQKSGLTTSVAPDHGVLLVRVAGELGWLTVAEWRSWEETHLPSDAHLPGLIDLSALTFLDSSGISALIATCQQLRQQGGTMAYLRPNALVTRWLRITGLQAYLPVFDAMEVAVQALCPPRHP
ncbi:STAS domain-containing protein [Nonomuraea rubra]|uniref:STAS domain-containing protein n=1 Tax=Nonomuraea rubra TaxID=46180 RepID=UPI001FE61D5C